jgi:hypothetical protein
MAERRTALRIPVTFQANFSPVSIGKGEGTIVDLAPGGCRIETRFHVPITTYLEIRFHTSLKDPLILVDLAAVRWAKGGQLGIEFLSLQPEHQARLQRLIDRGQSTSD